MESDYTARPREAPRAPPSRPTPGFGAFIHTIGGALAAPFSGIFRTTSTTPGALFVWAEVLAVAVYAIAAMVVAKVVSMGVDQRARRSA
jgi:hypothetical protein